MRRYNILVVDDEKANLQKLKRTFVEDYNVFEALSAEEALRILEKQENIDVIITDQRMPHISGVQLLEKVLAKNPDIVRIMLTGFTEPQDLIEAINTGRVYKYITKPWQPEALKQIVREALEKMELLKENERLTKELKLAYEKLEQENIILKSEVEKNYGPNVVYVSQAMHSVFELINKISATDTTVLIHGETGTGKEVIARYIHNKSRRKDNIFIPVNCAAIPKELIESEFFGHAKGAFTGAIADKKGLFEIANKGSIFLDEIGEAPQELQVKLLRVLQEGEILPIGSNTPKKFDVRVIASTNRDLKTEVEKGNFRQDLFFRLNVFSLFIPPLRERKDDIIPLAKYFLEKFSHKLKKHLQGFSPQVLDALSSYSWPGNVRELENEIERMVILADPGKVIDYDLISDHVKSKAKVEELTIDSRSLKTSVKQLEKILIQNALVKSGWNRTKAAHALGISRQSLIAKIRRYQLV